MKPTAHEIEVKFAGEEEPPAEEAEETAEVEETEEEPTPDVEEEEENEPEPGDTPEDDGLDDLDRTQLKMYIKENGLEVKVFKSDTDDSLRVKIREVLGSTTAVQEEEVPEILADEPDEFEGMSRDDLKRYIVKNKLQETVKVFKTDTEDIIRNKLREATAEAPAEEKPAKAGKAPAKSGKTPVCPAGGTYGKDADQHQECLECKFYKECAIESEK